uniref:Uncharacterized protein n=1 Tax=Hucho hucho TaxID=62062 RepID=A0A4W5PC12_9TELE
MSLVSAGLYLQKEPASSSATSSSTSSLQHCSMPQLSSSSSSSPSTSSLGRSVMHSSQDDPTKDKPRPLSSISRQQRSMTHITRTASGGADFGGAGSSRNISDPDGDFEREVKTPNTAQTHTHTHQKCTSGPYALGAGVSPISATYFTKIYLNGKTFSV